MVNVGFISRKVILLCFFVLFLVFVYFMVGGVLFGDVFEDFDGPVYLPVGFNETDNQTSNNERIFEYHGNGSFYVGVIKNTSSKDLEFLIDPFKDDPVDIKKVSKNLLVNGHVVVLKTSEKHFQMDGTVLSRLLKNSNIPGADHNIPEVDISMVKFQAIWYCNESKLTYVAIGLVTSEQMPEMEKMITSIKCHTHTKSWVHTPLVT